MRLINTIDLVSYDFSGEEDFWDQFWKKCLADENLGRSGAIEKVFF